jgi:hypothetical protein
MASAWSRITMETARRNGMAEMPYSKFKGHMRKLAERTGEGVCRAIRSFLPSLRGR